MNTTRRNMLAAVATLPIAACPTLAPASPIGTDPTWDRLCEVYHTARVDERFYNKRDAEWQVVRTTRAPMPTAPETPPIDASMPFAEIVAQSTTPEWLACWAAYEADKLAWLKREDADEAAFLGAIGDAYTDATEASDAAYMAMIAYPVASLAALAQKVAAMTERYGEHLEATDAVAVTRDVLRLAGKEA